MARSFTTMCFSAFRSQLACLTRLCRTSVAAWVTVLTVLFCATLPAGLPQSAIHGSAFNPATTAVALAAKAPERRVAAERRIGPDEGAAGMVRLLPPALVPASPPVAEPVWRSQDLPLPGIAPATMHAQALGRLRWAREPPLA